MSDKQIREKMEQENQLYKDKFNNLQRERTISTLTKKTNNNVFMRSENTRATYSSRFNRGWYGR